MAGIEKLVTNGIQIASQAIKKTGGVIQGATKPIEAGSEKIKNSLNCLAITNIPSVNKSSYTPKCLPDYLYHMTTKSSHDSILKDGRMHGYSFTEGLADKSVKGMQGTYMVSKNNFLHQWLGCKEESLFGDIDLGEALLTQVGATTNTPTEFKILQNPTNSMVAIQIPTSILDLSKLRFRPYLEASKKAFESYFTGVPDDIVTKGLPISKLPDYIDKTPIEFVYQGKITSDMFTAVSQSQADLSFPAIVDNLFRKIK